MAQAQQPQKNVFSIDRASLPGLVLLVVLVAASFWRVSGQAFNPDFLGYVWLLEAWQETGVLPRPHLLYPFSVILVNVLLPGTQWALASRVVAVAYSVVYAVVMYVLVWRALGPGVLRLRRYWAFLISVAFFVATPVVFTMLQDNWVLGYMAMTHNSPPMLVLRPFFVPAFLLTVRLFTHGDERLGRAGLLWLAGLSVIAVMTKPNYMLGILPTVGLVGAYYIVRRRPLNLVDMIWGIVIPGVLIMGFQYVVVYVTGVATLDNQTPGGLAILPFAVMDHHAVVTNPASNQWLALKFFASFLFPLVVYGGYFRAARQDVRFNIAWVFFFVNAFFNYFVVELGDTLGQWNFQWNGQVGFTVLFVVATLFLIEQNRKAFTQSMARFGSLRLYVALLAFILHFATGFVWYVAHLSERFKYMY